jgi:mRNA interferase MazF
MRPIHRVRIDKVRPALMLTREGIRGHLHQLTVATITATKRDIPTEVEVGRRNGLDHGSVVNLDLVQTVAVADIGAEIGWFYPDQEAALRQALLYAYDLDLDDK